MAKVSVIVPNYNHSLYLKERLESIFNQTYQNFEVIILDDSSTDNSREIIESYRTNKKVSKIVYNEYNSGSTFKQWEKGFNYATGEYIWIAESDDVAKPRLLEKCINELDADKSLILAFTEFYYIDSDSNIIKPQGRKLTCNGVGKTKYDSHDFLGEKLLMANCICNASMVVFRKKVIPKSTEYQNYRYIGDQFFWILLAQSKGSVIRINEPLNLFRKHFSNVTTQGASSKISSVETLEMINSIINTLDISVVRKHAAIGKYIHRTRSAVLYEHLTS